MIALIWKIIVGSFHSHEWETMERCKVSTDEGGLYSRIKCRCKKCGSWKKFDLK